MNAMVLKGYNGTMSAIAKLASQNNSANITGFFSKSTCNKELLMNSLKSKNLDLIRNKSKKSNKPIYLIIDDTIYEKTKPLLKVINTIDKFSFYN